MGNTARYANVSVVDICGPGLSNSGWQGSWDPKIYRIYDRLFTVQSPSISLPDQPQIFRGFDFQCIRSRLVINAQAQWNKLVALPTLRVQLWVGHGMEDVRALTRVLDISGIQPQSTSDPMARTGEIRLFEFCGTSFQYAEVRILATPLTAPDGSALNMELFLTGWAAYDACCHPRAQIDPLYGGTIDYIQPSVTNP